MPITIEGLNATALPSRDHFIMAMKDGITVKLSVGQVLDLLVDAAPEMLDTLNELSAAMGDDPNFSATVLDQIAQKADALATTAAFAEINGSLAVVSWLSRAVGEVINVFDERPGAITPPTDDSRFRYIKLTAGLTGVGQYNNGALVSEAVSGSSPYVTATAAIGLAGSPLNGQVVNLINTERRYLRAGSSGTLRDDQIKAHTHAIPAVSTTSGSGGSAGLTRNLGSAAPVGPDATSSFGGDETRVREIGISYYMRIK